MIILLTFLLLLLTTGISYSAEPFLFEDNFAGNANGSAGSPTWKPLTREWIVRDGVLAMPESTRDGTVTWIPNKVFGDVTVDVRYTEDMLAQGIHHGEK